MMDLQTYIIKKYGTGWYLLPSTMKQLLKDCSNVQEYKKRLVQCDQIAKRYGSEVFGY